MHSVYTCNDPGHLSDAKDIKESRRMRGASVRVRLGLTLKSRDCSQKGSPYAPSTSKPCKKLNETLYIFKI